MIVEEWQRCCDLIRSTWPRQQLPRVTAHEWGEQFMYGPSVTQHDVIRVLHRLARTSEFMPALSEIVNGLFDLSEEARAGGVPRQIDRPGADPGFVERWMRLAPRMLAASDDDAVRFVFLAWQRRTYTPDEPVRDAEGRYVSDWRSFNADDLLGEMETAEREAPEWSAVRDGPALTAALGVLRAAAAATRT